MTSYRIVLRPAARRDLKKILEPTLQNILSKLKSLQTQPRPNGVRKLKGFENEWRIRVGDHRILFEIDDENLIVRIFRIVHRKDAYR